MTKARDLASGGFGLVLVKPSSVVGGTDNGKGTVSFSAQSTVSLNDVFSATYDYYRIICNVQPTGTPDLQMRYRVSGSDNSTSNYNYEGFVARTNNTSLSVSSTTNSTIHVIAGINSGTANTLAIEVYKPFNNDDFTKHSVLGHMHDSTSYIASFRGGVFAGNTSFTGFTIFPSTGTITGKISVYGYNN